MSKAPPTQLRPPLLSVMLAVPHAPTAASWYEQALGATKLWNLGSVIGMEIGGAPFLLGEPENNGWNTPGALGMPSVRIEVFCDDPDSFVARAIRAGARGSENIHTYEMPWGPHRQGGFTDPFGHIWFVGDRSPLNRFR
ncbi:MAG TPA: VOC family protein [Phycisphaerales bacterium]|nr:VOC family protein [Phycisphaerales bacterium]HRQ74705.1 VOC family protein [Phycisphaerales bacterium]